MRHRCGFSSNAATAKLEVHINLISSRGAACSLGQLVPWHPPQWTAELKFHKDQGCFWNSAIVNVAKRDARCLNLVCECRPQLVWKSIHACDSHSFCCYNFRLRLPRACPLVTAREGSNDASPLWLLFECGHRQAGGTYKSDFLTRRSLQPRPTSALAPAPVDRRAQISQRPGLLLEFGHSQRRKARCPLLKSGL